MITAQVKDLCYGLYGKTAVPINPEVQKKALKGYKRGEEPITCRPAEVLEPELDKAKEDVKGLAADLDDVLIYALYPVTGKRFLKWKYGKEEPPEEVKPKTLEEVKREEELVQKALDGKLIEPKEKEAPEKSENLRTFNVYIDDEYFEVGVDEMGESPMISYIQQLGQMPVQTAPQMPQFSAPAPKPKPAAKKAPTTPADAKPAERKEEPKAPKPAPAPAATDGKPLLAPMPGMIISIEKKVGDQVNEGETVVILEAMKMENALPAPASGEIKQINFSSGDSVAKNDVICLIG